MTRGVCPPDALPHWKPTALERKLESLRTVGNLSVRDSHLFQSPHENIPRKFRTHAKGGAAPFCAKNQAGRRPGVESVPAPLRTLGVTLVSRLVKMQNSLLQHCLPGSVSSYLTGSVARFPEPRPGIGSVNHTENEFPGVPGSLCPPRLLRDAGLMGNNHIF